MVKKVFEEANSWLVIFAPDGLWNVAWGFQPQVMFPSPFGAKSAFKFLRSRVLNTQFFDEPENVITCCRVNSTTEILYYWPEYQQPKPFIKEQTKSTATRKDVKAKGYDRS